MEYIRLIDLDNKTEEELKAAIDCNARTFRLMSSKVDSLRKVQQSAKEKVRINLTEETEQEPVIQQVSTRDQEFEEEVDYYYSQVRELSIDNIDDEIEEVLPNRKNYDYERIAKRIQAELMKNIKELREFIASEKLKDNDLIEFTEEIDSELAKIRAVSKAMQNHQQEMEAEQLDETPNTLIFVPTSGGNIRVQDEIDHIDQSYYKRFDQLLSSIKDGTFKGVKKMHAELAGLAEVKDRPSGARITFMRLDKKTYAIISAFVKKSDNNNGYQRMVANHYQTYLSAESDLRRAIQNPEFVSMHQEIEQQIFQTLNPSYDQTPVVLKKRMQEDE